MKTVDHQLAQLFKAAARVPQETTGAISAALENRALVFWRNGGAAEGNLFEMLPLLRCALALACAVALATLLFHYHELTQPTANGIANIDSSISFNYLP